MKILFSGVKNAPLCFCLLSVSWIKWSSSSILNILTFAEFNILPPQVIAIYSEYYLYKESNFVFITIHCWEYFHNQILMKCNFSHVLIRLCDLLFIFYHTIFFLYWCTYESDTLAHVLLPNNHSDNVDNFLRSYWNECVWRVNVSFHVNNDFGRKLFLSLRRCI